MNILNTILQKKKEEILAISNDVKQSSYLSKPRSFKQALKKGELALIAEVKKASPSKGVIYDTFNPIELATSFERGGASCVSVLTDQSFFQGSPQFLMDVRKSVQLPVLRKDFIIDPMQVYESRAMGADVILLILDILEQHQAQDLIDLANQLEMDVLLEIHDESQLNVLSKLSHVSIVGVNNRDLTNFNVDINHTIRLAPYIRDIIPNVHIIAESGYDLPIQLDQLLKFDISGVLIGEGLKKNLKLMEWFSES